MTGQHMEKTPPPFNAAASVRTAFEILAKGAPAVAESLVELAVHGKSEYVRVQASTAILSRIGLPEKVDVGITAVHLMGDVDLVQSGPQATEIVRSRLKVLHQIKGDPDDADIVEGEVVEDEGIADVVQLFPDAPDE